MSKLLRLKRFLKQQDKAVGEIEAEQLEKITRIKVSNGRLKKCDKLIFNLCGYDVLFQKDKKRIIFSSKKYRKSFCSK